MDMNKSNCYLKPPPQPEQDDSAFNCGKYGGARQPADAKRCSKGAGDLERI